MVLQVQSQSTSPNFFNSDYIHIGAMCSLDLMTLYKLPGVVTFPNGSVGPHGGDLHT